jgi:hypothetical protein
MKKLTVLLIIILPLLAIGQTNYPPNQVPWNNHPTNWVYLCDFTGYGNTDPNAAFLPCGWYDEPTNLATTTVIHPTYSDTNLLINFISADPLMTVTPAFRRLITNYSMVVTLGYLNTCTDSNYYVVASPDLVNWTAVGTFTAVDISGLVTFLGRPVGAEYYRIYGPALPAPQIYAARIRTVITDPRIQSSFNSGVGLSAVICSTLYGFSFLRMAVSERKEEL